MRCIWTAYCFSEVRVTNITPQGMRLRCAVTPCIGIVFCVIIRLCKNWFLINMAAQSTFICLLYPKEMFFHIFADIASRCGGTPILMFACSLWFYLFNGEDRDHRGEKKQNGGQNAERFFMLLSPLFSYISHGSNVIFAVNRRTGGQIFPPHSAFP